MESLNGQQAVISDEILFQLCQALTFPEKLDHPPVLDYADFEGSFRDKIENIVQYREQTSYRSHNFQNSVWKRCEVGSLTGNQLLRVLVALCRNREEVITTGNCIILTVNGEPDAAMIVLKSKIIEIKTPSPEDPEKRRYYDKIFHEKKCFYMKNKKGHEQYFTDEKLKAIRSQVPQKLKSFLHEPFGDTSPEYRHTFIGMLQELIKFDLKWVPVFNMTRKIPVAACIWLAIHNSMSQKLQAMFGEHYVPKDEMYKMWRKENPRIFRSEMDQRLPPLKAQARLDTARTILTSTLPVDGDGNYGTNQIMQIVEQVKEFFQVSASY